MLKPIARGQIRGSYKNEPVDVVELDTDVDADTAMCVIEYTPLATPTGRRRVPFRDVENLDGPGVTKR